MSEPLELTNTSKIYSPGSEHIKGSLNADDLSRVIPRQLSTGSTRGTQTVGYGSVKIDGSNNRIQLSANGIDLSIGDTSDQDNNTGIALTDTSSGQPLVTIGSNISSYSTSGLTIYDDANTRRLLGGIYPNGTIAIKLSQPTFDVAVATDDQLIWSSDFNMFKIVGTGTTSVIVPASYGSFQTYSTTVTHSAGLTPAVSAFCDFPVNSGLPLGRSGVPVNIIASAGGGNILSIFYVVDDSNITFYVKADNAAATDNYAGQYNFKYYLMQETSA